MSSEESNRSATNRVAAFERYASRRQGHREAFEQLRDNLISKGNPSIQHRYIRLRNWRDQIEATLRTREGSASEFDAGIEDALMLADEKFEEDVLLLMGEISSVVQSEYEEAVERYDHEALVALDVLKLEVDAELEQRSAQLDAEHQERTRALQEQWAAEDAAVERAEREKRHRLDEQQEEAARQAEEDALWLEEYLENEGGDDDEDSRGADLVVPATDPAPQVSHLTYPGSPQHRVANHDPDGSPAKLLPEGHERNSDKDLRPAQGSPIDVPRPVVRTPGGLSQPIDSGDFLARAGLLFPAQGRVAEHRQFTEAVTESVGSHALAQGISASISVLAEECLIRFSAVEGDCSSPDLKGLGRMSSQGFPRLGGVLHSELRRRPECFQRIKAAVELTTHAGYLSVFLGSDELRVSPPIYSSIEALWDRWIPLSYRPTDEIFDFVGATVAVLPFWQRIISDLGSKKLLRQLQSKDSSPLLRSLSSLATVGATLAYVERDLVRR